MHTRKPGHFTVSALGLSCLGMSHGYGTPDNVESACVLHRGLDLGCTVLGTTTLYSVGGYESLFVAGPRYVANPRREIGTEEFPNVA